MERVMVGLESGGETAVTVHLSAQNGQISLTVQDNWHGFDLDTADQRGGIGLHSMKERVEQLGGALTIESAMGEGTTVTVQLVNSEKLENDANK